MPFRPDQAILDLSSQLSWGQLVDGPLDDGLWSLLQPAGTQNHAPQLCWLPRGQLACVWMAGDREGSSGMSVFWSLLDPESCSWSAPELLSQDAERSEQNPLLFVDAEAAVHLVHTAQNVRAPGSPAPEPGSAFSMQWTARLRHQRLPADSTTWTEAVDLLDTPAFCRHPPMPRPDGGWLLPIYRSLEAGGAFGHDHSLMLHLNASAQSTSEPWPVPDSVGRVHGSIVAASQPDTLLQFFRSRLADRVYRSMSVDGGLSWSVPEPTVLPNNNSSIQALRLASGRLALIFNRFALDLEHAPHSTWGEANWPRTRWPLSVAISEDDGQTWPWIRDIDCGEGFCGSANWSRNGQLAYPSILEGLPGDLHIAYSWKNRAAIRYQLMREADILGAPALGP